MFRRAAEGDREMREVAAYAALFAIGLGGGAGRPRQPVVEGDVIVHEIADRLNARQAKRRVAEQPPRLVRQQVAFAIAAGQQEQQRIGRQVLAPRAGRRDRSRVSKVPGSRITASVPKVKRPAGATKRLHQLPKLSR